jgi:hypothetical protein
MDPVTLGAVLLAVVSGASGELGTQLWASVSALVHRPFRHRAPGDQAAAAPPTGNAELVALEQNPADEQRAAALAEVLIARASADIEFRQALQNWWDQARMLRTGDGNIANTISGGTQQGPVLQGRDFGDITFGAAPVPRQPNHRA